MFGTRTQRRDGFLREPLPAESSPPLPWRSGLRLCPSLRRRRLLRLRLRCPRLPRLLRLRWRSWHGDDTDGVRVPFTPLLWEYLHEAPNRHLFCWKWIHVREDALLAFRGDCGSSGGRASGGLDERRRESDAPHFQQTDPLAGLEFRQSAHSQCSCKNGQRPWRNLLHFLRQPNSVKWKLQLRPLSFRSSVSRSRRSSICLRRQTC